MWPNPQFPYFLCSVGYPLQTHDVYSTVKRHRNGRFYVEYVVCLLGATSETGRD